MFAFPSGHNPKTGTQQDGMTLRDYFAAKVMQAVITGAGLSLRDLGKTEWDSSDGNPFVFCYKAADLMMEARKNG